MRIRIPPIGPLKTHWDEDSDCEIRKLKKKVKKLNKQIEEIYKHLNIKVETK